MDPSESMLEVCRERLQELNLLDRCELVHGYIQDLPDVEDFDAALCLLVLHHTSKDGKDRNKIIAGIEGRLKPSGYLIAAEISYDLSIGTSQDLMEKWQSMLRRAGSPEEKVQSLPKLMKEHLTILAPAEIEKILLVNKFETPVQFFQSLLIRAWYMRKSGA